MAKKGMIEKNNRRAKLAAGQAPKRARLKAIIMNKDASLEDRFTATLKLAAQWRSGAGEEPLRSDRPSPCLLSQIEDVAHRHA
jgi:hypothetical protein